MADKDTLNNTLQNETFDESLQKDSIASALGKDSANITQVNEQPASNLPKTPFTQPKLTQEEQQAQQKGMLDYQLGVFHFPEEDTNFLNSQQRAEVPDEVVTDGTSEQYIGQPKMDWSIDNAISKSNLDVNALYKRNLSYTAYEDLKYRCGLTKDASFTDYYNRTKFIPKGYEKEAKLLLAEEKRMKLYAQCQAGELSNTDFLYQAYGKDLLKESNSDFSSPIFWYNRYKKGDFSNPLESTTMLSTLIQNAQTLFEAEEWYKNATEKKLSTSLAGIVTGVKLSDEKVYSLFENQFRAISDAVDMDTRDIIIQYQAGNLNGVFNPFIDIDGDGKYDYYYHLNGKLYAIKGSNGTGDKTCEIKYDYDSDGKIKGVKSVEINEGLEGAFGGFIEGIGNFFGTLMDIVSMADNAVGIQFWVNLAQGDKYFVDGYQEYNAWKNRVFSNKDVVTFDGNHEWGYEIAQGIGTITGQIVLQVALALLTYGAGNAAVSIGDLAAQAGAAAAKAAIGAGIGAAAGAATGAIIEGATLKDGETFDFGSVMSGAFIGAGVGAGIGFAAGMNATTVNGAQSGFSKAAQHIASEGFKNSASFMQKFAAKTAQLLQFVTKGNSGAMFGNTFKLSSRIGNAAILAIKDFGQTQYNLHVTNKILEYQSKLNPDAGITPLTNGQIWGRALAVAGVDLIISSTLRLQNENGADSMVNNLKASKNGLTISNLSDDMAKQLGLTLTDGATTLTAEAYRKLPDTIKQLVVNMNSTIGSSVLANTADIVENLLTMSFSAAMNNPYAKAWSKESLQTFASAMVAPQSVIQNLYITARNFGFVPGSESTYLARQASLMFRQIPMMNQKIDAFAGKVLSTISDAEAGQNFKRVYDLALEIRRNGVDPTEATLTQLTTSEGYKEGNFFENSLKSAAFLSRIFDPDTVSSMDPDIKAALKDALSIKTDNELITRLSQVNKSQTEDGVELASLFSTIVFDNVAKENRAFLLGMLQSNLNNLSSFAQSERTMWYYFFTNGKKRFAHAREYLAAYDKASIEGRSNKTLNLFRSEFTEFLAQASKASRDESFRSYMSSYSINKIFQDMETKFGISSLNDSVVQSVFDKGYAQFDVASPMSLFNGKSFNIEEQADGSVKLIWLDSNQQPIDENNDKQITLFKLMSNREFINDMIKFGALSKEENGSYKFLDNPFFFFYLDNNKFNDFQADKEAKDLWLQFQSLADMCKQEDPKGERLINSATPLLRSYTVQRANSSSSKQSDVEVFVIPTTEEMTNLNILSALHSVTGLARTLYTLQTSSPIQADIDECLVNLGKASLFGWVDGWRDMDEFKDLSLEEHDELKLRGIASLLYTAKLDSNKDDQVFGINRAAILRLCTLNGGVGAISRADLKTLKEVYEAGKGKGLIPEASYNNIIKLDSYLEKIEQVQPVLDILARYSQAVETHQLMTITANDTKKVMDFLSDLSKPETAWLKDALIADGNINNNLIVEMINHPELRLPFLRGLEDLSRPLTHLKTSKGFYTNEIQEAVRNKFDSLLENYNTYARQQTENLAITPVQLLKNYLKETISSYAHQRNNKSKSTKTWLPNYSRTLLSNYKSLLKLDDNQLINILNNPVDEIQNFFDDKIKNLPANKATDVTYINDLIAARTQIQTELGDSAKLMLTLFGTIDGVELDQIKDVQSVYDTITSKDPSVLKDYINYSIKVLEGNRSNTIEEKEFTLSDNKIMYNGKELFPYLQSRLSDVKYLIRNPYIDVNDIIQKDLETYHNYLYSNTKIVENPNVIEVDFIDLVPNNYKELLKLIVQSEDYYANESAKASYEDVINEINKITSRDSYGNYLDSQMATYMEMIDYCINNGCFTVRIDLSDTKRMNALKKHISLLGYTTDDIINAEQRNYTIPGVMYKNISMRGIETKINYTDLCRLLATKVKTDFMSKGKLPATDYTNVMENMFRSSNSFTDTSRINLYDQDGNLVKLFGLFNDIQSEPIYNSLADEIFNNPTKKGLAAGAGAKTHTQVNKAVGFNTLEGISKDSLQVYNIVNAIKEYFLDEKKSDSNPVLRFDLPNNDATRELIKNISKFIPSDAIYTFEQPDFSGANAKLYFKYDRHRLESIDSLLNTDSFDMLKLFPIFFGDKFKPTSGSIDVYNFIKTPNQSLLEYLISVEDRTGISSYKDLFTLCEKPINIYNFNEYEYKDFISDCITIKDIKDKYLSLQNKSNYYIQSLINYIYTGEAVNNFNSSHLIDSSLYVFQDKALRRIFSSVLKDYLVSNTLDTINIDSLIDDVLKQYNQSSIRESKRLDAYTKNSLYYTPKVTSGSISKLNIDNDLLPTKDIRTGIETIIDKFKFDKDFIFDTINNATMLKHNPITSLLSLIDTDSDGNAFIPLDYLTNLSTDDLFDLPKLILSLSESISTSPLFDSYTDSAKENLIKQLNNLSNDINAKVDNLKELVTIKDNEPKPTIIVREPIPGAANTPSIRIGSHVLYSKDLADPVLLEQLIQNQSNTIAAKKPFQKYITTATFATKLNEDNNFSPIIKMYNDLLNNTLIRTVDKAGHTYVYNMESAEARAAFIDTTMNFAQLLLDNNIGNLKDLSADIQAKIFTEIALACNLYSSGTSIASEYSGALLIEIPENADNFDAATNIKPIVVSSSNKEKDLLGNLLLGEKTISEIKTETTKKHILITMDKNAFSSSLSGYNSKIKIYDLDDSTTQQMFIAKAIVDAEKDANLRGSVSKSQGKLLLDYYTRFPTVYETNNQLVKLAISAGMPKLVAEKLYPTIKKLDVSQPVKFGQEQVNVIAEQLLSPFDAVKSNRQVQAIKDIFIHGICYDALSDNIKDTIDNMRQELVNRASEDSKNIADVLLTEGWSEVKDKFNSLTEQEQIDAIQLYMLRRQNGSDLEYILSTRDVQSHRQRIADAIEQEDNNAYVNFYNEQTGKFESYNWRDRAINGKAAFIKNITPYNIVSKSNTILYDSEWAGGKDLDLNAYQIAFIKIPQSQNIENIGLDSLEKHNIIIIDNLKPEAIQGTDFSLNGVYHIESDETYKLKLDLVKEHTAGETFEKDGIIYHIVNTIDDAHKLLNDYIDANQIKSIMGFNNKSIGSDDDKMKQSANGSSIFNKVHNLDIRLDLANNLLSDNNQREAYRRDAMDFIKAKLKGAFTDFGDKAHDAIYDVINEFELYRYLVGHRLDIKNVYDEGYQEFKQYGISDELLNKALSFDYKVADLDMDDTAFIANLNTIKKSNPILKNLLDAYNSSEALKQATVLRKEFARTTKEILLGSLNNPLQSRVDWYNSVKDYAHRNNMQTVMFNLINKSAQQKDIRKQYLIAQSYIYEGIKLFRETSQLVKEKEKELGYKPGNEMLYQMFYSQDIDTQASYIAQANKFEKEDLLKDSPERIAFFKDTNNINIIASQETESLDYRTEGSAAYNNVINHYINQVVQPLYNMFKDTGLLDSCYDFTTTLFSNLLQVYGDYDNSFKQAIENKKNNITRFVSNLNENLFEFIKHNLSLEDGGLFASSKALYVMATEKGEFNDTLNRDIGEFGCVYIGDKLLNKAFPTLSPELIKTDDKGRQYFYTQVWRQPGQGKTSHILKVYVEPGNSMQMTRATSQTYFNGDFDGDSYFFGRPDKVMQEYGEAMFEMSRAGSSLFDLFTDTKISYDDNAVIDNTGANLTNKYKASFMKVYSLFANGRNDAAKQYLQYFEDMFKKNFDSKEEADIMWSIYGIHIHQDKEGNEQLFCKNFALYTSLRNSGSLQESKYADMMDEAGRVEIFQNQYTTDFDSQLVGNIAKNLQNDNDTKLPTKDLSKILYANDINLNAASLLHLNNVLQSLNSQDEIKSKLVDGVKAIKYLTQAQKNSITESIQNFNEDITALDILGFAQLIQRYVTSSSQYKDAFTKQLNNNLSTYTNEYKDKYTALYNYCKQQLPDFSIPTSVIDPSKAELSGPQIMHNAAMLMQELQKYSQQTGFYISSYKNNTMRRLMNSVLTQGNLDVKSSRTATVIGANGSVSINNVVDSSNKDYTQVGLTKMKVMVLKKGDTSLTDGILSTKYNKTKIMNLDKISLHSLPQDIIDSLTKTEKLSGQQLTDLLHKTNLKRINLLPEKEYKIYVTKDALVVREDMSYNDLVKQGYAKQGRATTKAGKGTVSYFDGKITAEKDSLLPDMIMSADLFDLENEKGSMQTNNKYLGKCTYDGNDYDVYEIDDVSLLNSWNQNSLSVGEKPEDRISILQGQTAIDAFITMGGATTLELSKDGIKFNPEGLNEYLSAIDSFNKPVASETNGAKEIKALQIAALLSSVPQNLQAQILTELGCDTNLNKALSEIYQIRSLGKDGDDIIEVIKNIIWKQPQSVRKEVLSKLQSNEMFKKLFGNRIASSISEYQQTSQDLSDEQFFRSRWDIGQKNPAETKMHKGNITAARYAASVGSGEDLNGNNFYSRVQLIEDLLDSHLSKDMLTKSSDIGLFNLEKLIPTSQLNGFHSLMETQVNRFGRKQELTPQFKHGGQQSPYTTFINDESASAYISKIPQLEKIDMSTSNKGLNIFLQADNKAADGSYKNKPGYMEYAHRYFLPYMSNGEDDSMVNLMSNQTYRMSGMIDTPYMRVNNTQTSLELGTYHRTQGLTDAQSYHKWLNDELKNSYSMQQKSNKLMSAQFRLNNQSKVFDDITDIKDFLNNETLYLDKSLKDLFDRFKAEDEFTNVSNFHDMEYYLKNQLTTEDYVNACKLYSEDNQTEITSSFFSSSGMKSKGNIALDLDNRVIYLNTQVETKLENILGKEFTFLVKVSKDSPSLIMAINKYMDIKYKLDVYDTLIATEKKQIRQYGKDSYNKMLLDAKKLISPDISKFETNYKELTTQLNNIASNEFMSGMLSAIDKLNLRLTELAQSYNPLALIGYYLPQYTDSVNNKIFNIATRVDAYKMATDYTREILNGYKMNPDGSYSFATSIYNSKEGYLGMVNKIAQQFAVTETMKEFGTFLKTQGYMRNLDVYSQAHSIFTNELRTDFINSFKNLDASTKLVELNTETYNILKAKTNELLTNKQQTLSDYIGAESFIELYETLSTLYDEALRNAGCQSASDLELKYREALSVSTELRSNSDALFEAIKVKELYECTLSSMLGILEDNGSKNSTDFLKSLYTSLASSAKKAGYTLVDNRGAILDPSRARPTTSTLDIDDIVQECKLMFAGSKEAEIAKMALLGDVYMMRDSVAEQLDSKVFTKTVPGTIGKALSKAKNYVTSFIMASPISVIDRKINFTMFDVGTLMSADVKALRYLMPCIATIERYAMNPDSVTETAVATDKYLQLLLRYMAASGQTPVNVTNIYGEEVRAVNIPVVKQIMSAVQKELAKQQFYARFAYFCDLVVDGELNDFNLNPKQFGVAFHLQDGLKNLQANNKDNFVYKNIYNFKNNKFYSYDTDADYLQRMMNMDAAALQVVAENVGVFGNMPAGSKTLSKLGMMFTGFPLAAARWGKNRVQSLGYALTHLGDKTSGAWGYLGRNLGSSLATYTLLLALQILLSNDTKEYLNKRIYEKKSEEETEDELGSLRMANVKNILFRGGCIRPFQSWLNKEEYVQAGHSRDALSYLWNSWVADFFLKEEDETVGDAFWNVIKTNLWNHVNPLIKDVAVESWFIPEDNYFENLSRKAAGYVLGSAQASTLIDSMKASKYEDKSFLARLATGFQTAYSDSFSNTKEYKSSWKNYKKAFELVYNYTSQTSNNTYDISDSYSKLKKDLTLALKMKSSPKAFYEIIEDALNKGTSISEVKAAVDNCSLRYKLMKLDSIEGLKDFLTDNELAVIKSALAYEDYMFPYLTTYIDDVEDLYNQENKNRNKYATSIANKLRTFYYNAPTYNRAYNSNTRNYVNGIRLISNANLNQKTSSNPMASYEQARKNINYGVSSDIYGNKTQNYTNGTSYQQRTRGSSIIPGGNA